MIDPKALAVAWDEGYDTAARCYWHKPRNPYSGEMNDDDPSDYCVAHGGTGSPLECDANWKPGNVPCPGVRP